MLAVMLYHPLETQQSEKLSADNSGLNMLTMRTMKDAKEMDRHQGPKPPPPASAEYLKEILAKSQRKRAFPIRRSFVQRGKPSNPQPGPLADFVTHRDETALDLYMLLLAAGTAKPHTVILRAEAWARALKIKRFDTVSRAWGRLEQRRLVARGRAGNKAKVTPLKEDGSGKPYVHPFAGTRSDPYGQVPLDYWIDGWFDKLHLPGKAMLLVMATWRGALTLPAEKASEWYGISADTCERGFDELRRADIVRKSKRWKPSIYAPGGWVAQNVYGLTGPFARSVRKPNIVVLARTAQG